MEHFNMTMLEVHNFDESVAMSVLNWGLHNECLIFSLDKVFLRDYANLLAQAQKYAQAKEARTVCKQAEGGRAPNKKCKREDTCTIRIEGESFRHAKAPQSRSPPWCFNNYAPLTTFLAQILMKIEGQGYLHQPPSLKSPSIRRNKWKYYPFHRDHVHDTEDHLQLKDKIETLIIRGYLNKYVQGR